MSLASPQHPGRSLAMPEVVGNLGERGGLGQPLRAPILQKLWIGEQDSHVRSHDRKLRFNLGESDSHHR